MTFLRKSWMLISVGCLAALFTAAQDQKRDAQLGLIFPGPVQWEPRFQGVDYAEMILTHPRPLCAHAVRIDLSTPGIGFVTTPDNGERPEETDGWKTSTFLQKSRCQIAVNANPFSPVRAEENRPQQVRGLLIHDGERVSNAEGELPAVLIHDRNQIKISPPPFELKGVNHAVGGFSIVLRDGAVTGQRGKLHPRTAAGVSADGRYLYLLVVDGRQPGYSEGASTEDIGAWLRFLGADDGINLDGGGTSTMVFDAGDGKVQVVNRPIHAAVPGQERVSGAHLGVKASRLP